jgi:hypothetical protein
MAYHPHTRFHYCKLRIGSFISFSHWFWWKWVQANSYLCMCYTHSRSENYMFWMHGYIWLTTCTLHSYNGLNIIMGWNRHTELELIDTEKILLYGDSDLTLSNPIFLPPAYSPALIYFGRERGWWFTCSYPTVLKEKNKNRKSTTCAICWLKSVLHEEKCREQENHNVGRGPTLDRKGLMAET